MDMMMMAMLAVQAVLPTGQLPVAQRPDPATVLAAVRAEWPRYDIGAKGHLTRLEFGTWVVRSHGGTVTDADGPGRIRPTSAMNATATAFARADADHDGGITPEEMTAFLLR